MTPVPYKLNSSPVLSVFSTIVLFHGARLTFFTPIPQPEHLNYVTFFFVVPHFKSADGGVLGLFLLNLVF